jgi:amino acid transporter
MCNFLKENWMILWVSFGILGLFLQLLFMNIRESKKLKNKPRKFNLTTITGSMLALICLLLFCVLLGPLYFAIVSDHFTTNEDDLIEKFDPSGSI